MIDTLDYRYNVANTDDNTNQNHIHMSFQVVSVSPAIEVKEILSLLIRSLDHKLWHSKHACQKLLSQLYRLERQDWNLLLLAIIVGRVKLARYLVKLDTLTTFCAIWSRYTNCQHATNLAPLQMELLRHLFCFDRFLFTVVASFQRCTNRYIYMNDLVCQVECWECNELDWTELNIFFCCFHW